MKDKKDIYSFIYNKNLTIKQKRNKFKKILESIFKK